MSYSSCNKKVDSSGDFFIPWLIPSATVVVAVGANAAGGEVFLFTLIEQQGDL